MKKCGNCRSTNLAKINLKDRELDLLSNKKITKDCYVLKCLNCENLVLTAADLDKIHELSKLD